MKDIYNLDGACSSTFVAILRSARRSGQSIGITFRTTNQHW